MNIATFKPCALVPVYNHEQVLAQTLAQIQAWGLPVVLVDDGSHAGCKTVMRQIAQQNPDVHLIVRDHNGGKGAAVKTGLNAALHLGFSHALQIDADGQHTIADIPRFLEAAALQPQTLIVGIPVYDASVPKARLYGRYITHVWVWINTLSLTLKDSMCGFRVYPLARSGALITAEPIGNRMDYDTEFLVRWYWRHWPVQQLSTRVIYPPNGVSHFLAWRDNKLISWMHTRLFFGMLWRLPRLIQRKLSATKGAKP